MDLSKHQILEPLSSMIELSLLSFSKNKPKLSIKHHGIMINNSGEGYIPRNISRFIFGDSKEDLTILHPMILNYLNWFIIDNRCSDIYYIYKNIAVCAVYGLKKLQTTYKIGNVVFALQYYINLIMKTLVDIDINKSKEIIKSPELLTSHSSYLPIKSHYEELENDSFYSTNATDIDSYGFITDEISLSKWSIPDKNDVSLVDTQKIKTIWNIEDLKNVYDMLQGCYDMSVEYEFKPKNDSVVEAKVKALTDVLVNKDKEFHVIIKNSYGGN